MRALFAKFVTAIFGAGLLMTATATLACTTGCPPPAPPVRPTPPTPPSMPCNSCTPPPCNSCGGGGNVNTNVNVNVNVNANVNASSNAAVSAFGFGFGQSEVFGGGYGNWSQAPGMVENAGAMNIETGAGGAAYDMVAEKRSVTRTIVIEASCIDDTGVPHPASQLSPERAIANDYMGEVYRCIAGTHMQVTMADFGICDDFGGGEARISESESSSYSRSESHYESGYMGDAGPCSPQALACSGGHGGGYAEGERRDSRMTMPMRHVGCGNMDFSHINFDGGKMMTCQKGDALWFERGNLSCKVQIPQRQCNERSLLRRFGTGIKVLTITRIETTQHEIARHVERSSASSTVMTFNGGVGGFVE